VFFLLGAVFMLFSAGIAWTVLSRVKGVQEPGAGVPN